jgi:uncharacterized lipoprotein YmbA
MTPRWIPAWALTLCLGLAACAGISPEPTVYTLAPVAGAADNGVPAGGASAPRTIELRRVGLAGYLDRPQIVRTENDNRLAVSDADRWGEPLDDMIGRVLTEDLGQRLPGSTVIAEAGAISTDTDAILEVEIRRFDADPDGTAVILAQVSTRASRARVAQAIRTVRFTVRPAGPGAGALVAALSTGLGQLADTAVAMLRALPDRGGQSGKLSLDTKLQ